jgi:formylglycine-generating enzyme required for sulfatase activity
MKHFFTLLFIFCSLGATFKTDKMPLETESRLALVIGNSDYDVNYHTKLNNPTNDADAMTKKLKELGFEVFSYKNLSLKGFNDASDKFYHRIKTLQANSKNVVTVFYYSGHGMHVGDVSYLIPVNCKALAEIDLIRSDEYGAFPLHDMTNRLVSCGNYLNIVMLDACRNNGFVQKIAKDKGKDPNLMEGYGSPYPTEKPEKPSGMYFSFATAKGATAKEGNEKLSPYVEGFLNAVAKPNQTLENVIKATGKYVSEKPNSTQSPCMESRYFYEDFIFNKKEIPKDTDGDGFIDAVDKCPYEYAQGNNGCPEKAIPTPVRTEIAEPNRTSDPFASQMIYISGGSFSMGSSDEKPIHSVTLSSFYMSKYEVTQKQWQDIMGTNPSYFKNCDNCPVEQVSWNDIQDFIRKLNTKTGKNYRLPTEAEWEYAARGGQNYKYAGSDNLGSVAWYRDNSGSKTHPVGQKSANGYGLYDMAGNVWEWCSDWYGSDYYNNSPSSNPKGPNSGTYRVLRGGSWDYASGNCRAAHRSYDTPPYRNDFNGFRLVLP